MDETTKNSNGWQVLQRIALPFLAPARSWSLIRFLELLLHVPLMAAFLFGLWHLNSILHLEKILHSPWPALHDYWLPLFFLLLYVLSWLGACMWRCLFDRERPLVQIPDIDTAWAQAMRALGEAGLGVDELPLFLILGRPQGGLDSLFQAAGSSLIVQRAPHRLDAPLHIYATRQAIFVACEDSSLLGQQTKLLPERAANSQPVRDQLTARLKYLCRLLSRMRSPYCPVNGLVVLHPLASVINAADANRLTALTQLDIQAIHQVLEIDCPCFALVCDLETAPGFREFIEHVPPARRQQPLGQAFPLVPDVDAHEIQEVMEKGVATLGRQLLSKDIYQSFSLDLSAEAVGNLPAPVRTNFRVYQLFAHLRQCCQHLGQVLYRGTQIELGTPAMVAGCYFVATGTDSKDQAFAADVLQEVCRNQNFVAWSPQAIGRETAYRRLTRLGYLGLLLFFMILGVLGYVSIG